MIRRILVWTRRLLCAGLVAGVLLVWLAPDRVLPPLATFLDVSEPPSPVDYALVLNGDPETRPFAAAALVKAGLAKGVLLTRQRLALESDSVRNGELPSELEITRRVLLARGVPERAIRVLDGEIGSTADEAKVLASWLKQEPEARVAVVTNGFHTLRARWIFLRAAGQAADRVRVVGVPRERVDARAWWRSREGCNVYASEYAKLLYYGVRF